VLYDNYATGRRKIKMEKHIIELPCNVGDTIYVSGREVKKVTVLEIRLSCYGNSLILSHCISWTIPFEQMGKTVFLTQEEAEKAIQK
jgi:hypothetical protein